MTGFEKLRQRLLEVMEQRNLSLREAAEEARVSHATISNIRALKKIPSPATLRKLEKLLGVELDVLLEWAGHKDPHGDGPTLRTITDLANELALRARELERRAAQLEEAGAQAEFEAIPITGRASAGREHVFGNDDEVVWKPRRVRKLPGNRQALEVVGTCLAPEIQRGDVAIVDPDLAWQPGKIIAIRSNGGCQVKRFVRQEEGAIVLSSNEGEMRLSDSDTRIAGVVRAVQREFD
jgi:phage repressor protein C with HTH and peptisase S24 domain